MGKILKMNLNLQWQYFKDMTQHDVDFDTNIIKYTIEYHNLLLYHNNYNNYGYVIIIPTTY